MANYIFNREAVGDLYNKSLFYGADADNLKKLYHVYNGTNGEFYEDDYHDLNEGYTIDVYYVPKSFNVETDDFDDLDEEYQEVLESYKYDDIYVPIDRWDYWTAEGYEAKEPEAEYDEYIEYGVEVLDENGNPWRTKTLETESDWIDWAAYYYNDATPLVGDDEMKGYEVKLHVWIRDEETSEVKSHKKYDIQIGHFEDFKERIGKVDNYKLCLQETK